MKFTKILTIAFTLAFAYAQSADTDIVSDVESNQVPDYAGIEPQNTADSTIYAGENSDDYGDANGVDAYDGMGEDSDDNTESNPISTAPSSPVVDVPESSTPPESTVPEATAPEVDAADENESIMEQKDEIPQEEIPLSMVFSGASGEAAPVAAAAQEAEEAKEKPISALDDETKTDTSIDPAKIASGLVGAACLSSAGIFFMVKRAKRRGLESVRSQITMA